MKAIKEAAEVAKSVAQGTSASPTSSATPAGQTEHHDKQALVESINQVFALFRLNYHNQFLAAYPDSEQLGMIMRLWRDALSIYAPETILAAGRHAIESSDYLPTLNRMLGCCHQVLGEKGLPGPRDAFLEACTKPSPKHEQAWSHPLVYFAGRDSDWFYLANNAEKDTFPVFKKHYDSWLARFNRGELIELPQHAELPKAGDVAMTETARREAIAALRKELAL